MDRYNEMIKGKRNVAILFTLALIIGVCLLVAKYAANIDVLFVPGVILTVAGAYVSSILWAVIQSDRMTDEKIIVAITQNNLTSFNDLNKVLNMNVDKLIKRVEYLANKECFPGYMYDITYGLRLIGADGNAIIDTESTEVVDIDKRENLGQCRNCGASLHGRTCPYCGGK